MRKASAALLILALCACANWKETAGRGLRVQRTLVDVADGAFAAWYTKQNDAAIAAALGEAEPTKRKAAYLEQMKGADEAFKAWQGLLERIQAGQRVAWAAYDAGDRGTTAAALAGLVALIEEADALFSRAGLLPVEEHKGLLLLLKTALLELQS